MTKKIVRKWIWDVPFPELPKVFAQSFFMPEYSLKYVSQIELDKLEAGPSHEDDAEYFELFDKVIEKAELHDFYSTGDSYFFWLNRFELYIVPVGMEWVEGANFVHECWQWPEKEVEHA